MAMIYCNECGKEISDKADKCPHCGCPVNFGKKENTLEKQEKPKNGKIGLIGFIISFVGFIFSIGGFVIIGLIAIIMGIVSLAKKENKKWMAITAIILSVAGFALSPSDSAKERKENSTTQTASNSNNETNTPEASDVNNKSENKEEPEEQKEIEYISVTATELSDALENNAMKAENDYKGKYLEVSGTLGNIDSSGKYIGIDSDKDFDLTNIQCYLKTDEQKEIIMEMSKGDTITVKGYCKDIGEILGYQIDIEEVVK